MRSSGRGVGKEDSVYDTRRMALVSLIGIWCGVAAGVTGPAAAGQVGATGAIPYQIQIPAARVDAPVLPGSVSGVVPNPPASPWQVAWYESSGRLGVPGNVVMAGYREFPLIGATTFAALNTLGVGDSIEVLGKDRQDYHFKVTDVDSFARDDIPLKLIFARVKEEERLTLMTVTSLLDLEQPRVTVVTAIRGLGASAAADRPTAEEIPSPEECDLAAGVLPDGVRLPRGSDAPPTFPPTSGEEADEATIDAISAVVRSRVACVNDANFPALLSLCTESFLIEAFAEPPPPLSDVIALAKHEGRPLKEGAWVGMPSVEDVRIGTDGRVAATIRPDPNDLLSTSVGPTTVVFLKADGIWRFDSETPVALTE